MRRAPVGAWVVLVLGVFVLSAGFVLSVLDSGDRPIFDDAEACRELSRTTLTSTPVNRSKEEIDAAQDRLVKFFGHAAHRVASLTRPGVALDALSRYADVARSRTWTTRKAWNDEPANLELQALCKPYLTAAPVAGR